MTKITRQQRVALKKVYDRGPIYAYHEGAKIPMSYREFRKTAIPTICGLMVKWCDMWLGIEEDGYTHS